MVSPWAQRPVSRETDGRLPIVPEVAGRYGFRLVEHVHIRVDNGATTATVTGIAHRYPRSVRVPLSVARRLVAAGAPLTVERIDSPTTRVHA